VVPEGGSLRDLKNTRDFSGWALKSSKSPSCGDVIR